VGPAESQIETAVLRLRRLNRASGQAKVFILLRCLRKTRILQLRSRQIDHRITVCKVGDLNVFPKPFLDLKNHIHVHKVHAHEVHARAVHAREMHVYEVHAREVHAREMHL
jgi:hypothetical protein